MFGLNFGKSKSSSKSSAASYVDPGQQGFLSDIYNRAQGLSNQQFPVADVAGLNPSLMSSLDYNMGAGQFTANTGMDAAMLGAGVNTAGLGTALGYAQGAAGSSPFSGVGGALGTAGAFAGMGQQGSAYTGSGFNPGMSAQLAGMGAQTGAAVNQGFNQANLGNYINNEILQGQIDAASRDITRNLQENQLVGNASMAAGAGGSGSSRRAVMDAIATRGAADRAGDISAAMRGQAYGQALGVEADRAGQNAAFQQQANLSNQSAYNQLLSQGAGIGSSQLGQNLDRMTGMSQFNAGQFNQMLGQGAGLGQGMYGMNLQNAQFGAGLARDLGAQGFDQVRGGTAMMGQGGEMMMDTGQYLRDYEQALLDRQYNAAMGPYNALNFFSSLVGDPTVLNKAESSSKGKSMSAGIQVG